MTTTEPRTPGRILTAARRFRWIFVAPLLAVLALSAWAFASPIGSSPDDDYHLASIWCANEARTDLCTADPVNGEGWRVVLPGITTAPCFVADGTSSGGCQEWTADPTPTVPADHGNWIGAYPPVFYAVMNLFATTDIQTSALVMRLVNVLLFVGVATALAVLLPARFRVPLVVGWSLTMVPLGAYLVASNNPGAWAIIGVGGSWLAALGWFQTTGRRSWALGALTAFCVLLAAGARTDAAIYSIIGLGVASVLAFARTRAFGLKLLLPAGLVLMAILFYFTSGYAGVALGGLNGGVPDSTVRPPSSVLAFNAISIPQLWTGVFGSWGLGWRMEVWPGFWMVEFAGLAVFIGIASLGILVMPWRKAAMVLALVATLYLLPLYILTRGGSVVSENVQPRYILPLVIVLAGLIALRMSGRPLQPGGWHIIPAIVLLAGANLIALYTNLRRYITGFDVEQFSLESGAEWWWSSFPVGPTVLWIFGSLTFAAAVTILGVTWLRRERTEGVDA